MNTKFAPHGMTLMEVMFATAIFTVVMGAIFSFVLVFGDTSNVFKVQMNNGDEIRRAQLFIVSDLHQAIQGSIATGSLPGPQLTYSVPVDLDGNNTAVDQNASIESSLPRTIQRDTEDLNGDQQTTNQLIAIIPGGDPSLRVLANSLTDLSEQTGTDGVFGPEDDTNGNGRLDRGIWFESVPGGGIRVTIETQGLMREIEGVARPILTQAQETIIPRN